MTVSEAIQQTQRQKAGFFNRLSVQYAQELLLPEEEVLTAVVANIQTRRDSFPGVVVLTDQRVLAVCGLPGIKRQVILSIAELERCEEVSTVIQYKATFHGRKDVFCLSIDPDDGEAFSPFVAEINGEEFEDIKISADGNILNSNLIRSQIRNKQRKQRAKTREMNRVIRRQQEAAAHFDATEEQSTSSK